MHNYLTLLLLCFTSIGSAQLGPGGVHGPTENRFWFKADVLLPSLSDNNNVGAWTNSGGNGTAATASGGVRPKFRTNSTYTLNGYPVLVFNGNNDRLQIADNNDLNLSGFDSERSNILVFQTENDITSRQVLYEEGGGTRGLNIFIENGEVYVGMWNNHNDGVGSPWGYQYVSAPVQANTPYILATNYEGNSAISGTLTLWLNGVLTDQVSGLGYIYAHSGDIGIGAMINASMFFSVAASGNGNNFDGRIAEFIIYNQALSTSARSLIENYLSAKYDITLNSGDLFSMDNVDQGNFDHDAAGIGMTDPTDALLDAQGSGILGMANPATIDNNTFLGWGHDHGALTWNLGAVPTGMDARLNRNWKADLSGGAIGRVDIRFDLTNVVTGLASDFRILVDANQNGDYSDDEPLPEGPVLSGSTLTFNQVNLPPNRNFTLGYSLLLLPVELIGFDAYPSGHEVRVKWTTLSEMNNDLFAVERSADGNTWQTILFVDGAGNSQYEIEYEALDADPIPGTSYYRLKQMDFSGAHSYSDVVAVSFHGANELALEVWPNPSSDKLNLRIGNAAQASLELFSLEGKLVSHMEACDFDVIEVDVSQLPRGFYVVHYTSGSDSRQVKILLD